MRIWPLGYIPIDSVHSPVRKVKYTVEAARLGQMTDYDKLVLEVWTNGAISPQDAVGMAAEAVEGPHDDLHQLRGSSPRRWSRRWWSAPPSAVNEVLNRRSKNWS